MANEIEKTLIDTGIAARQAEILKQHDHVRSGDRGSDDRTLRLERAHEFKSREAFEKAVTGTLESPIPAGMEVSAESLAIREINLTKAHGAEVGKVYNLKQLVGLEKAGWQEIRASREKKARLVEKSVALDQRRHARMAREKIKVQEILLRSKHELLKDRLNLDERIEQLRQKMLMSRGLVHAPDRPRHTALGVKVDFQNQTVQARAKNLMQSRSIGGPKKPRDRDR